MEIELSKNKFSIKNKWVPSKIALMTGTRAEANEWPLIQLKREAFNGQMGIDKVYYWLEVIVMQTDIISNLSNFYCVL